MPVFTATDFVYNNKRASDFGCIIAYGGDGIDGEYQIGTPVQPLLQSLSRRSKVYNLGIEKENNGALEFELSFYKVDYVPFNAYERDMIATWLLSDHTFKPLQMLQDDMSDLYYNCYFKALKYIVIGGSTYGFVATAVCDSSFAWKNEETVEIINKADTNGLFPSITEFDLYNISSDINLTTPILIEVDMGNNTNEFKVTNISNNNEFFEFKNLVVGDKVKIDDLYSIECITRPNTIIVDNFNGEFMKLVNGLNKIKVDGEIKRIKIVYQGNKMI